MCSSDLPDAVTERVIEFLQVPAAPVQIARLPQMARQSDALSAEWIARYLADPNRIKVAETKADQ